jgi:hypothetical protein
MPNAIAGRDATILVNHIDASQYLNEYEIERSADDIEVTRFGAIDKQFLSGPHENTVTLSGHWSGDEDALDDVLENTFGVAGDQTCTICPRGAAEGLPAFLVPLVQTSEDLDAQADDLTEDEWEFRASSVKRAKVLIGSDVLVSGTTAVTSVAPWVVDGSTNKGASAHLHILGVGATTSAVVKVEGSADGTSWVAVPGLTFTAATEPGHQRLATLKSAVIPAQLRASVTLTGTAPTATVVLAVARHIR